MGDSLTSLAQIKEWLDAQAGLSECEAQTVITSVIPAMVELETVKVQEQAVLLQKQALQLAGLDPSEIERQVQALNQQAPTSCAICENAIVVHSMGAVQLACIHLGDVKRYPPIAEIGQEIAFYQPDNASRAMLLDMVRLIDPPAWCPLRG